MANTYIHTLPDTATIDPNAYTILDSKNQFDQYVTSKVTVTALADFTIGAYAQSDVYLRDQESTSWVAGASSDLTTQTIFINNSASLFYNGIPLRIISNTNAPALIDFQNSNTSTNPSTEIKLKNNLNNSYLKMGIMGSNYNRSDLWSIGAGNSDSYVYSNSGNLMIGTQSNKDILLYTNSPSSGNVGLIIKGNPKNLIGINTVTPNQSLTVNGNISSNQLIYDIGGNSNQWNRSFSYFSSNSSNIALRSGSTIVGKFITTNTLTGDFIADEFVSRRYVDAVLVQATVSGNFIPSLYYTKTETEDLLINPNLAYGVVIATSASNEQTRNFVNSNSLNILEVNTKVNTASANWNSVYSYINQASSKEEDQNETVNFVLTNSANILQVNTNVNLTSAGWNDLSTYWINNSSLEVETRSFVNSNSANIVNTNTRLIETSANWNSVYSFINQTSSSEINQNESTTFVLNNSANIIQTNSTVNSLSGNLNIVSLSSNNWNSNYSSYNNLSSNIATLQFVDSKFLPLTGGRVLGSFFATQIGVGNTVTAGLPGNVIRKMEIFNANGVSLGFIPIYDTIS